MRYRFQRKPIILLCLLLVGLVPAPMAAGLMSSVNGLTAKVKPVAQFFSTFASSLSNALLNTLYSDRSFMVYNPPAAADPAAASTSYGIGFDFGFRGAGDIQSPFGFKIDQLGRYVYTPMTAMLYPGFVPDFTDLTGQKKKPLSLGDGIAPELIKGLLSIFVGGQENAEKAWAPIGYFTIIQPETIFFLKLLTLLNSARKNSIPSSSTPGSGRRPNFSDIPFELMCLLFRVVISPDIPATVAANDGYGPDKAFRWTKVVTLSRPSKLVAKMPKFFVELLQNFKPSIDSREIQEYKDRFGSPLSDMQQLYAQARAQRPYENRVDFIKKNIIEKVDVASLNPTDQDLFFYMIRQIISERFKGLKTYITSTSRAVNVTTDDSGIKDASVASGVASTQAGSNLIISIDVARMTDYMAARIPKIKDFIAHLTTNAKKFALSDSLVRYIGLIGDSIEAEFTALQQSAADLAAARKAVADAQAAQGGDVPDLDPSKQLEQRIAQTICDKLDAIAAQEAAELAGPTGNKIAIPLLAYLDIKFWQVMRSMQQPFVGDKGYMVNDASLSVQKALVHAYAIFFRANLDLMYVENLVKTNSSEFVLKDQQGNTQTVTGKQIYKDYTDGERYLLYCEQQVTSYRASLGKMTPAQALKDPQLVKLMRDADNASILFNKARAAFRHALRQFEFDRRVPRAKAVGAVMLGGASMSGLGDVNVLQLSTTTTPAENTGAQPAQAAQSAATLAPAAASTPSSGATPAAVPAAQPAVPAEDDPMSVFGGVSSAAAAPSPVAASAPAENPVFSKSSQAPSLDDPFTVFGGTLPASTPQQQFLNLPPQKYDYPRTINEFMRKEFARLALRSPDFKQLAEQNLGQTVYEMTGMRIEELLAQSAGEQSDIEKQEDLAYLPGDEFFTSPTPSAALSSGGATIDMAALGKALNEKYGTEVVADESSSAGDSSDSPVSETDSAAVQPEEKSSDSHMVEDVGFSMTLTSQEQQALDAEALQASQGALAADTSFAGASSVSDAAPAPVEFASAAPVAETSTANYSSQDQSMMDQPQVDMSLLDASTMQDLSAQASAAGQMYASPQPQTFMQQPAQNYPVQQQQQFQQSYGAPTQTQQYSQPYDASQMNQSYMQPTQQQMPVQQQMQNYPVQQMQYQQPYGSPTQTQQYSQPYDASQMSQSYMQPTQQQMPVQQQMQNYPVQQQY